MKALVYEGVETLALREVPDPIPAEGEVLVRVEASGICGSDMHAYLGHDERRPAPLILGHEAAGLIASGPRAGTRVTMNPLVTFGTGAASVGGRSNLCDERQIISMMPRPGAFADFVCLPEQNLIAVPDHVPMEKAALAEPLACGWHAVRLAFEKSIIAPDQSKCLVLGGGAIGFGAALALRAFGVQDITLVEPNEARRENLAKHCDFILLPADPPSESQLNTMDVVIDGVGYAQTREAACAFAKPGSVIAHIGLGSGEGGLDIRKLTLQEITFFGTYTYTQADFADTAAALFDGRLGALEWAEQRPLEGGIAAFQELRAGQIMAPKIVLTL